MRAMCLGDLAFTEAAFAELAGIPVHNARLLIHDAGPLGFKAIYERCRLPAEFFELFRIGIQVALETDFDGGENDRERHRRRTLERILTQYEKIGARRSGLSAGQAPRRDRGRSLTQATARRARAAPPGRRARGGGIWLQTGSAARRTDMIRRSRPPRSGSVSFFSGYCSASSEWRHAPPVRPARRRPTVKRAERVGAAARRIEEHVLEGAFAWGADGQVVGFLDVRLGLLGGALHGVAQILALDVASMPPHRVARRQEAQELRVIGQALREIDDRLAHLATKVRPASSSPAAMMPLDLAARSSSGIGTVTSVRCSEGCLPKSSRTSSATPISSSVTGTDASDMILISSASLFLVSSSVTRSYSSTMRMTCLSWMRAKMLMSSATPNGARAEAAPKLSMPRAAAGARCRRTRKVAGNAAQEAAEDVLEAELGAAGELQDEIAGLGRLGGEDVGERRLAAAALADRRTTWARSSSIAAMMRCISRKRPENSAFDCLGRVGVKASRSSEMSAPLGTGGPAAHRAARRAEGRPR